MFLRKEIGTTSLWCICWVWLSVIIIGLLTNDTPMPWLSKPLCRMSIIYSLPVQMSILPAASLRSVSALTLNQKFFLFLFYPVENLHCNGTMKGQKWPMWSTNEEFLIIMFSSLCYQFWAWVLVTSSFPMFPSNMYFFLNILLIWVILPWERISNWAFCTFEVKNGSRYIKIRNKWKL